MTEPIALDGLIATSENAALIEALKDQKRALEPVVSGVDHLQKYIDDDGKVITVDTRTEVEEALVDPSIAKGTTVVHGLYDMVSLAGFWLSDHSRFVTYANEKDTTFTTILDHDFEGLPGWRRHRLMYRLEPTTAMAAWLKLDRRMVEQLTFAEHIEDRMRDIIDPESADLLEIAQTLSASGAIQFRSGTRLRDGATNFTYVEETEAAGGQDGTLPIPARFTLMIPPFIGAQAVEIGARFRWRMKSGDLTLGYLLDDIDQLTADSFEQLVTELDSNVDWTVVRGEAPTQR